MIDETFTTAQAEKLELNDLQAKSYTLDDGSYLAKRVKDEDLGTAVADVITNTTPTGLVIPQWNTATPTFNSDNDVWVFEKDSVTVSTVTITYTDTTKAVISSVVQT